MRVYEVVFIIRPDVPEAEIETLVEQMQEGVVASGGKVEKVEKWGKRQMAYRVDGNREGFYVLMEIAGTGEQLRELERRLKVAEPVIKQISVRVDEERKRLAKLRHRREHRAARRQHAAHGPAGSAETPARA